jgi:hypothetical protein
MRIMRFQILTTQQEAYYTVLEAIHCLSTPRQLRVLFVQLLVNDCIPAPLLLWHTFQHEFSMDYFTQNRNEKELAVLNALQDVAHILFLHRKLLSDYGLSRATFHSGQCHSHL